MSLSPDVLDPESFLREHLLGITFHDLPWDTWLQVMGSQGGAQRWEPALSPGEFRKVSVAIWMTRARVGWELEAGLASQRSVQSFRRDLERSWPQAVAVGREKVDSKVCRNGVGSPRS